MAPDLGLDLKLCASKIVTNLSNETSSISDDSRRIAKLEEYVRSLEEERRKIEVFKRELPLCMFLLNDVIGGMKEEVEQRHHGEKQHVLEEFMPIKSKLEEDGGVKLEKDCKDKMNWMSSAQLWSDNYSDDNRNINISSKKNTESGDESDHRRASETPSLESKSKSFGGAFVPFKCISAISSASSKEDKVTGRLPDLPLVSGPVAAVLEDHRSAVCSASKAIARCQVSAPVSSHVSLQSQQQALRKARRCWSPELHRRFVAALHQLGGAQVATPKQIRDLMKVDGLTNDEVKSHLQKYRLHTRRMPNSSSSSANRPVVVMGGGFWVPQQQQPCTSSQQSASQSGSPQGPLQLAGSSRAVSVTAGDSCEEDGKSESYSWK